MRLSIAVERSRHGGGRAVNFNTSKFYSSHPSTHENLGQCAHACMLSSAQTIEVPGS